MQLSVAIALQVAALASAAVIPVEAGLEKRLQEAHADVTQVSYGPICHLHCRRALAALGLVKRVEVDVQQNNYALPWVPRSDASDETSDETPEETSDETSDEKDLSRRHVEVDVQQSNYALPPSKRNSGRPEAHADVTPVSFHYPLKRGEPADLSKRLQEAHADVTQVSYGPICHLHCRRALAALADLAKRFMPARMDSTQSEGSVVEAEEK